MTATFFAHDLAMPEPNVTRWPDIADHAQATAWLKIQSDLGLAPRTVDAYGRALDDFLSVCRRDNTDPETAGRAEIARYVRHLREHTSQRPRGDALEPATLSNATIQQRLVAVRVFYDHLVQEGVRKTNPVGRGHYSPGNAFGSRRGLVPHVVQLPWVLTDEQWSIARQVYNAKDPMTLFELQAWLGHTPPESTQHYAKLTPLTLAKAYTDAGYFARNIRAIEVLIDRDAVQVGATATGTPWQYFDVGHGYCTYSFFEQCPHRMACPRCDFYVPKGSSKAQLLEAKANLQRMLVEVPLSEEERAAVEDGQAAVDKLLERLADVPTPAGPTPRSLGRRLPVINPPRAERREPTQ